MLLIYIQYIVVSKTIKSVKKAWLACRTGVIFAYFRQTEEKARQAWSPSLSWGEEHEKNNACAHTIVQAVPAFTCKHFYPIGYIASHYPWLFFKYNINHIGSNHRHKIRFQAAITEQWISCQNKSVCQKLAWCCKR